MACIYNNYGIFGKIGDLNYEYKVVRTTPIKYYGNSVAWDSPLADLEKFWREGYEVLFWYDEVKVIPWNAWRITKLWLSLFSRKTGDIMVIVRRKVVKPEPEKEVPTFPTSGSTSSMNLKYYSPSESIVVYEDYLFGEFTSEDTKNG